MSKYIIKTEVEAVLLIDKDAECIQGIADMLPEVPHFFTDEGIIFSNPDAEADVVTYGMYIIKESHGISAMSKELFEAVGEIVTDDDKHFPILENKNGITVRELKILVKNLPEINDLGELYEVWLETEKGLSSICKEISPLNKREEGQDIILSCAEYES